MTEEEFYKTLEDNLDPLGTYNESHNPLVGITYTQINGWKYFLYEYDTENKVAFGYVMGWESEFGTVDMEEQLEVFKLYGRAVLPIAHNPKRKLSDISDFISSDKQDADTNDKD